MKISKRNSEGYPDPTAYEALCRGEQIERDVRRKHTFRPLVFICSPLSGEYHKNRENARRYCRFAVCRGTIPIAPHLLFPQFLDDSKPEERNLGIFFGLVLMSHCREVWVFGDRWSHGMRLEIAKAEARGLPIRYFDRQCEEVSR